jgi:hypothetical protein
VLYDQGRSRDDPGATDELAERGVVIVDGLDQLRLPGRYGSSSSTDYQRGRQHSLLEVVGDGIVPIERRHRSVFWPSRRAFVICCGVFPGLKAQVPGPDALTDWGIVPALAERLCAGVVLRMAAPEAGQIVQILQRSCRLLGNAYNAFGYGLVISRETLAYVAERIVRGEVAGIREGLAWLSDSADLALVRMVREAVEPGGQHVLAPDDLRRLPQPSQGMWRE